jgi:hypothetical protein
MKQSLSAIFLFLLLSGIVSCKKDDIPGNEIIEEIEEEAKLDEKVDAVIPHIYIDIDGGQEVVSKDEYLKASVEVDGKGKFDNLSATLTSIKGRGNSTWNKPKKPYRLKLDKKASILGLTAAKNWVLLANYQDYTLMTNAVAMKIGQQLGLPYTHKIIPVDVTVNGEYKGSYTLTQQVEIGEGRVNVGDDGVVLELDNNYDEDYQFISSNFNLPVMVKDAEIDSDEDFNPIKAEFQSFEDLLVAPNFPNNNYGDYFDKKQLVNYLIVNDLAANFEINHPKSVYMHKAKGGKYTMGPIWDFDWGFGMDEDSRQYFSFIDVRLLRENDERKGAMFLKNFMKDPEVRELYIKQWAEYRNRGFNELMLYIEEYAALIRESQKKDYAVWGVGVNNLPQYKADLKTYLRKRANLIDSYVDGLKNVK